MKKMFFLFRTKTKIPNESMHAISCLLNHALIYTGNLSTPPLATMRVRVCVIAYD